MLIQLHTQRIPALSVFDKSFYWGVGAEAHIMPKCQTVCLDTLHTVQKVEQGRMEWTESREKREPSALTFAKTPKT